MQLRYRSKLTFAEYVRTEGWRSASLDACTLCPPGHCRIEVLGTYMRKVPEVAYVARFVCRVSHVTIGMLPDFYASRRPGTLPDMEEAAVRAEEGPSVEGVADELRPDDADDAVTLPAAVRWVRRRLTVVHQMLATVRGLLPELFESCEVTVRSFRTWLATSPMREQLATPSVLVALREICSAHLHSLPAPLGLVPPPPSQQGRARQHPQSSGPDPPADQA